MDQWDYHMLPLVTSSSGAQSWNPDAAGAGLFRQTDGAMFM